MVSKHEYRTLDAHIALTLDSLYCGTGIYPDKLLVSRPLAKLIKNGKIHSIGKSDILCSVAGEFDYPGMAIKIDMTPYYAADDDFDWDNPMEIYTYDNWLTEEHRMKLYTVNCICNDEEGGDDNRFGGHTCSGVVAASNENDAIKTFCCTSPRSKGSTAQEVILEDYDIYVMEKVDYDD